MPGLFFVHFSARHFMQGLADTAKVPAEVPKDIQVLRVCCLWFPTFESPPSMAHPLRNKPVWTISRVNHGLTQLALVPPPSVFYFVFQTTRPWKSRIKNLKGWCRDKLRHDMVNLSYCLDRVVPGEMSQVSRWSKSWTINSARLKPSHLLALLWAFLRVMQALQKFQRWSMYEKRAGQVFGH